MTAHLDSEHNCLRVEINSCVHRSHCCRESPGSVGVGSRSATMGYLAAPSRPRCAGCACRAIADIRLRHRFPVKLAALQQREVGAAAGFSPVVHFVKLAEGVQKSASGVGRLLQVTLHDSRASSFLQMGCDTEKFQAVAGVEQPVPLAINLANKNRSLSAMTRSAMSLRLITAVGADYRGACTCSCNAEHSRSVWSLAGLKIN